MFGPPNFKRKGLSCFAALLPALFTIVKCQYIHSPEQIKEFFKREEIIPDVLVWGPTKELRVKYGKEVCNFGTAFTASEVKEAPKLGWDPEPGAYYTLVMTDPDVPTRQMPTLREYQHWLVVNIPENRTHEGKTMTEYLGVVPEQTKTIHRYVFFVYKQPGNKPMEFDEVYKDKEPLENPKRARFNTQSFARSNELGNVTFGNYFLSGMIIDPRHDDNVDEEYRKVHAKIDLDNLHDDDDWT